ncbi:2-octaprenyl-6-methoxyphenyl hydroxylase [Spongorhabdus nitratireducens]
MSRPAPALETEFDSDVVIIGGGMVGAALALALAPLARSGLKVTVIEPKPLKLDEADKTLQPSYQPSYDARASALSYGARLIFEQLGVWDDLSSVVTPIRHVHVSEKGQFGITRLNHKESNVPALGYVVENRLLGQCLLGQLEQHKEIRFRCPAEVQAMQAVEGGMSLTLNENGEVSTLRARLAVLADGGRSALGESLGIETDVHEYGDTAIITNVTPGKHHDYVAWERFTDQGAMALLPLSEGRCALVWTMSHELAAERMALDDNTFLDTLQKRFGFRMGRFTRVGERHCYPLSLKQAREQVRPGLVVLGNAAHSMHPVAGQGFNLSLRDAVALADVIKDNVMARKSPGALKPLLGYVDDQQRDQLLTMRFCDLLVKGFGEPGMIPAFGRNLGLAAMEAVPPLRRLFAREAMGVGSIKTPRTEL